MLGVAAHGSVPAWDGGSAPAALAEVDPAQPEPPSRQPIKLGQDGGAHRRKPAAARGQEDQRRPGVAGVGPSRSSRRISSVIVWLLRWARRASAPIRSPSAYSDSSTDPYDGRTSPKPA